MEANMKDFLALLCTFLFIALIITMGVYYEQTQAKVFNAAEYVPFTFDPDTSVPASVEMVAELNEKVKVYRVEYRGEVCYHTVGYLHGWTVSTDCL
jgi:hypothetical protein